MGRRRCGLSAAVFLAASSTTLAAPLLQSGPTPGPGAKATVAGRVPRATRLADEASISLLRSALAADPAASPVDQRTRLESARQRLAPRHWGSPGIASHDQAAAAAFAFLHQQVLTGAYDPSCARLQRTLSDGTYNCLTATLLYLVLCRDAGLRAVAVATPGHVAVRVWLSEGACHVETTDGRWRPQPVTMSPADLREISDQALLGRLYYNLGIDFARQGNFSLALRAARTSCQLDPNHAEARTNLLAMLNNWSLELARQGNYERAEALIREGLRIDAEHDSLRRTDAHLRRRRSTRPRRQVSGDHASPHGSAGLRADLTPHAR